MGWKEIWARLAPKVISLSTSMEGTSPYITEKSDAISSGDKDTLRNIQDKEGSLARKAAAAQLGLAVAPQILPIIANPATASTTAGAIAATGLDAAGLVGGLNQLNNYWNNRKNLTWNDTPGIILNGLSLVPGSSQLTNVKNLKYLTDAAKNGIRTISQPLVNRWQTSVYNNLMPFSYSETYLQGGKKYQEFTNAIKDFITPKRIVENPKWQNWATSNGIPGYFKYDWKDADKITAIRQEIYKRYLGMKSPEHFYIKNSDGTYSYNFDNLPDYVKQNFIDAVSNKFRGFGKGVSVGDFLGSAGGNVHATITKMPNGELSVKYFDIFDVNPFKNPNRVVDALPNWTRRLLYKTKPSAEYGITVTDTKPLGKLLKDFELSDITGGKPVVVKNSIDNVHEVTPTELTVRRSEMPMNKNEFLDNYIDGIGFWDIFPVSEMSKEDVLSEINRITKEAEEKGVYKDYIKSFNFNSDSYLTEKTSEELSKEFGLHSVLPENSKILQKRPISEAERLGIPKGERSNPKALEDPYYWGYQQWNQRYNAAVESGNMEEAQRLRDLHFIIKTPSEERIMMSENEPFIFAHTTNSVFNIFDASQFGKTDGGYHGKGFYFGSTVPTEAPVWSNLTFKGRRPIHNYGKNKNYFYIKGKPSQLKPGSDYNYFSDPKQTISFDLDTPIHTNEFVVGHPEQIKLGDAMTFDDNFQLIPIVKRDNFHNLDIRYKQGGILKGQNSMKIPESATSKAYFSGLKDYLFHTTKSFIPSKYKPTKGNDIKTQYYTRPELKEEVALSIFGGTDKNAKGILGDRNYFYKDFDDAYNQIINTSTNLEPRVASNGTLGNYMISAGEDNGRRYLSFIDKFDHVIIPGKPIPIYDRIYEDEIDSLYNKNRSAFNEGDWITRSPILNKLKKKNRIIKGQNGFLNTWQKAYNSRLGKGLRNFLNGTDSDLSDEEYLEKHGYNKPVGSIGILGALVAPEWEGLDAIPVAENFGRTGTVKAVPKTAQMISTKIKNFEGVPQVSKVEPVKELTKFEKFLQRPIKEQDDIVRFWNGEKFSNMEMLKLDKKAYQQFKNWINK